MSVYYFFLPVMFVSFCDDKQTRPAGHLPLNCKIFQLEFSSLFAWNSPENPILKLFIFYEVLPLDPLGNQILISGTFYGLKVKQRKYFDDNFIAKIVK